MGSDRGGVNEAHRRSLKLGLSEPEQGAMADSVAFNRTCELLAEHTAFSDLEARGTVRLALRSLGQSAKTVGKTEMMIAVRSALEPELAARSVADAGTVCRRILDGLAALETSEQSPYEIFSRLG